MLHSTRDKTQGLEGGGQRSIPAVEGRTSSAYAMADAALPFDAALNDLNHAIVIIAPGGAVVFRNRLARLISEQHDGMVINDRTIRLWKLDQTTRLRKRIEAISCGDKTGQDAFFLKVDRPSGRLGLLLTVESLAASASFQAPAGTAVITVVDPERSCPDYRNLLKQMFGLTPAEASVAEAVFRGTGVKAAAKELGVEPTTVRTLLQRVFAKTQTCRQAELVRLIGHARSLARSHGPLYPVPCEALPSTPIAGFPAKRDALHGREFSSFK